MRYLFFTLGFFLNFYTPLQAQQPVVPKIFVQIPAGLLRQPDGNTLAMRSYYICQEELSNLDYREFLASLEREGRTDDLETARIRTEGWKVANGAFDSLSDFYHLYPDFEAHPVVNITQAAARLYCQWLTGQYVDRNPDFRVTFRLPTETEWIYAAQGGMTEWYPYPHGQFIRDGRGLLLYNFRRFGDESIHFNRSTGLYEVLTTGVFKSPHRVYVPTTPAAPYTPNGYGVYHTSGNVAEMLDAEGRTKGGCFYSSGYDIRIDADDEFAGFTGASPYIGFRPIAVAERK